jgi:hypothetical protein
MHSPGASTAFAVAHLARNDLVLAKIVGDEWEEEVRGWTIARFALPK